MNNKYIHLLSISLLFISLTITSCKKLIEIDPPKTLIMDESAFMNDESALSVLSNLYAQFNSEIWSNNLIKIGMYGDEMSTTSGSLPGLEFLNSSLTPDNVFNRYIWQYTYGAIYRCNAIIENLQKAKVISPALIHQMTGEAKFLRAFCYFYLVNTYGAVPLLTTTDVNINAVAPRVEQDKIYDLIISDLKTAQGLLKNEYPTVEKVRANKWAATALLARVYLYQKDWGNADTQASLIINSGNFTPLESPDKVFLSNSKEAIFQFWTVDGYSADGITYIPVSKISYPITTRLLNAFEPGDLRKLMWTEIFVQNNINYYYPFKYKKRNVTTGADAEYLMVLRVGEQYLIRAEARVNQNKIDDAITDLNVIRSRANLTPLSLGLTKDECLEMIAQERRIELFSEWGHRFYDLKRTGKTNEVLGLIKPLWKPKSNFFPIPRNEISSNPFLIQNEGYN